MSAPGTLLVVYEQHAERVAALAWSPDGAIRAPSSRDKMAHIWDSTTGNTILTYAAHASRGNAVAWFPDGTCLASGRDDGKVHLWGAP